MTVKISSPDFLGTDFPPSLNLPHASNSERVQVEAKVEEGPAGG